MSLLTIDENKCKKGGECVDECPFNLIEQKDRDSFPYPIENADELCINCGHCMAICPHGALALKTMPPEDCKEIKKELDVSIEQTEQLLSKRRSIRTYKDKPVEQDILERLIDITRYGATGKNAQPVRWAVISGKDQVRELEGLVVDWMRYMIKEKGQVASAMSMDFAVDLWEKDKVTPITCGAPHIIVSCAQKDAVAAQEACIIAMTFLDIAAPTFGLGTCWAGFFNAAARFWPPMQKELGLPEGAVPFCSMMIGYPKYKYKRIPIRNSAQIKWM